MDPDGLRRLSGRWRLPLGTVEKDHAITVALGVIGTLPCERKLVLKGGTALRKIYFDNYRFSEDLDFTGTGDVSEDLVRASSALRDAGATAHVPIERIERLTERRRMSRTLRIRYRDMHGHANSIRVEVSLRERIVLPPVLGNIRDPYGVVGTGVTIRTLALPEIFAEKVRALHTRSMSRDLYDLWRLILAGVAFDRSLTEKKLRWWDASAKFDLKIATGRIARIEPIWKRDLSALLPRVPRYDDIAREVQRALSAR